MDDDIAALVQQEGWRAEGDAARVHYGGDGARFSVEYYTETERVLYWQVPKEGETAAPVPRTAVPDPLRERIRLDLEEAGIDPAVERESL